MSKVEFTFNNVRVSIEECDGKVCICGFRGDEQIEEVTIDANETIDAEANSDGEVAELPEEGSDIKTFGEMYPEEVVDPAMETETDPAVEMGAELVEEEPEEEVVEEKNNFVHTFESFCHAMNQKKK